MQVAESKGLPKLKYHLLPRTKGFWLTVQNLRGTGEYPNLLMKYLNMATVGSVPWTDFQIKQPANNGLSTAALSRVVAAVYDSTLNFRNNEAPTLLGILNGKKYHADLYVRYKKVLHEQQLHGTVHILFISCLISLLL